MKQTNSTLTFLSAQYRAVMKDAYLKGLASTALLSTAAMGSIYASTAEAAPTDLNEFKDLAGSGEVSYSKAESKDISIGESGQWNANLNVTNGKDNGVVFKPGKTGINVTGAGSLTVSTNDAAVVTFGDDAQNYEFAMNIGSIDVKQGKVQITAGKSGAKTSVAAKNITIGTSGATTTTTTGTHLIDIQGKSGGVAALGNADSKISLNKDGQIHFNGSAAGEAVLNGQITGNGGAIEFKQNGTFKAGGKTEGTNFKIYAGKTAVFDFDAALAKVEGTDAHLVLSDGQIEIKGNSGGASGAAAMHVKNGNVHLTAKLVGTEGNSQIKIGDGDEQQSAKLSGYWGNLTDYLNAKSGNRNNIIEIEKDGTLEVKLWDETKYVSLGEFALSDKSQAGKVKIADGATIQADKLHIGSALVKDSGASEQFKNSNYLNLKANTLKLSEPNWNANNADYGFKQATTKKLEVEAYSGDTFNLKNVVNVVNTTQIDNPYAKEAAKITVGGENTVDGIIQVDGGGKLVAAAGTLTANGKLKVDAGTLQVGGAPDSAKVKGIDATLVAKGGLEIMNQKAGGSVQVWGNSTQDIPTTGTDGKITYQSQGKLDLTSGDLTVSGHATNFTAFKASNGTIALNQKNADELLNTQGTRTGGTAKGAAVELGDNAVLDIQGDLRGKGTAGKDGTTTYAAFDANNITKHAGNLETDMISFKGTGNTVVANNAHLAGEALQIGHGNTLATRQVLTLDSTAKGIDAALQQARNLLAAAEGDSTDSTADQGTPAKAVEFQLRNGTVSVGTALKTTVKNQTLTVTHDETNSAVVELGQASLGKDRFGQLTQSGSAGVLASHSEFGEAKAGSVDMAMKLDGLSADQKAALKVKYGTWNAQDITASNGLIEIGSEIDGKTADQIKYGDGGTPVLNAQTVTLADGSKVVVNVPAIGSFKALNITSGSVEVAGNLHADAATMNSGSAFDVTGKASANSLTMESGSTINVTGTGNMVVAQAPAAGAAEGAADGQYAFTSKDGSEINVTGHRAKFTIGAKGLDGLKLDNATTNLDPDSKYAQNVNLSSGGTLSLGFESGTKLSSQDLIALKKEFLKGYSGAGSKVDGALDIGKAVLTDIGDVIKDGRADWDELEQYVTAGSLDGVINEQLANTTVYNVNSGDRFTANVGNIEASGDVVLGNGSLNNAGLNSGNNFISQSGDTSKVGNAKLEAGAMFAFKNGGNVGDLTLNAGSSGDLTTLVVGGDTSKTTNIASIKGAAYTMVDISAPTNVSGGISDIADLDINSTLSVGADVTADRLLSSAKAEGSALTAKNLTVKGTAESTFNGDLNITEKASFAGKAMLGGNNTFGSVEFNKDAHLTSGKTSATNVTIGAGNSLFVGTDGPSGTTAVLAAQRLDLNGGTLYADPEYGQEATMVLVGALGKDQQAAQLLADAGAGEAGADQGDQGQADQDKIPQIPLNPAPKPEGDAGGNNGGSDVQVASAGTLNGNIHALKNSIVAIGVDTANLQAAVEDIKNTFAPYLKNGSLQDPAASPDAVGAIAYVAKPITVANGSRIVVDAGTSNTGSGGSEEQVKPAAAGTADTYIGKNSSLAMSAQAVTGGKAAVTFEKNDATIYAEEGARVLLAADGLNSDQSIKLFADGNGTVTLETANNSNLKVQSVNGLFEVEGGLAAGEIGDVKLTMNQNVGNTLYHDASRPVRDTIMAYNNTNGNNELLNKIKYESTTGRDADSAARLSAMGGAVNAALTANRTTTDAVAARMGTGVGANAQSQNISSMGSNRGSVWAAPVYSRSDSSGLEAEGQSYGNKVDMYGMAVGADYRVSRDIEVGAVVNVGKGEVEGDGLASNVSNDVSYVCGGVYARVQRGQTSVVGDITYTQADNDLSSNLDVAPGSRLSATADTKVISAGVTAKYDLNINGFEVSPHAGARFSQIKTGGHDVKMGDKSIASYSAETMNVVSVPAGVTVSRNINSNGWNIKPSADVHVSANLGDISSKGEVTWSGTNNLRTNVDTEVMDRVTYGAAVGVSATRGNFTAGAGVSYNGSSTTNEVAVGANVRYDF